jgi:hypothetical protein
MHDTCKRSICKAFCGTYAGRSLAPFETQPLPAGAREPREIPDTLLATITNVEPYRSQAIVDARAYLALPKMVGIGLIYEIVDPVSIAPFDRWDTSISPLTIKLRWSQTMYSGFTDYSQEQLHRVAVEDDQWKIISVWDDALRKESFMFLEQLKRFSSH